MSDTKVLIDLDTAFSMVTAPGFDGYGETRIYGVIQGGDYDGQLASVKNEYQLNQHSYSSLYLKTTTFNDLIINARMA